MFESVAGPECFALNPIKMSVHVRFVVPRDGRAMEVGRVNVTLRVFDPARTLWNLRRAHETVEAEKMARSTIVIKEQPKQAVQLRGKGSLICKAVTLSGAPCKSRASCGDYCRRHYFVSKE